MTYLTHIIIGKKVKQGYFLTWEEVKGILGREHKGSSNDDEKIVDYLVDHTEYSQDWFGEGTIDEDGWYISIN